MRNNRNMRELMKRVPLVSFVALVLVGCASFNSHHDVNVLSGRNGQEINTYGVMPFLAHSEIWEEHPEADEVLEGAFIREFMRTGYKFIKIDASDKIFEEVGVTDNKVTEDHMIEIGRRLGVDAIIIGDVTAYNYLDIGYRVKGIQIESRALLWEGGGIQRIPWYKVQIEPAVKKLTRKIINDLIRKGVIKKD